MEIAYSKRAGSTPAFELIAEGWNEIVQNGFTPEHDGVSPVLASHELLYAYNAEGEVLGFLSWVSDPAAGEAKVTLAYVEVTSRKTGIFNSLWSAFKQRMQKEDIDRITLQVGVENKAMQAVLRHIECVPVSFIYDLQL